MAKYGQGRESESPLQPVSPTQEQVHRLSRLAGQIGGIARMIEEGRTASDILTQIKAVRSALNAVEERVIQTALKSGIENALELPDRQAIRRELEQLFGLQKQQAELQRQRLSQPNQPNLTLE